MPFPYRISAQAVPIADPVQISPRLRRTPGRNPASSARQATEANCGYLLASATVIGERAICVLANVPVSGEPSKGLWLPNGPGSMGCGMEKARKLATTANGSCDVAQLTYCVGIAVQVTNLVVGVGSVCNIGQDAPVVIPRIVENRIMSSYVSHGLDPLVVVVPVYMVPYGRKAYNSGNQAISLPGTRIGRGKKDWYPGWAGLVLPEPRRRVRVHSRWAIRAHLIMYRRHPWSLPRRLTPGLLLVASVLVTPPSSFLYLTHARTWGQCLQVVSVGDFCSIATS